MIEEIKMNQTIANYNGGKYDHELYMKLRQQLNNHLFFPRKHLPSGCLQGFSTQEKNISCWCNQPSQRDKYPAGFFFDVLEHAQNLTLKQIFESESIIRIK